MPQSHKTAIDSPDDIGPKSHSGTSGQLFAPKPPKDKNAAQRNVSGTLREREHMTGTNFSLNDLFDEWESAYKGNFQRDGIVDEEKFRTAPWRILFVTKEANNILKDLRDQGRDASTVLASRGTHGYVYWRALARWSYALLNGFAEFNQVEKNYAGSKALLSVALMNIKKCPGGAKALMQRIEEFAIQNVGYIIREINLINPHIVICGGVGQLMKALINPQANWHYSTESIRYFYWGEIPILNYKHPSYYGLRASELDPPLVKTTMELLLKGESQG